MTEARDTQILTVDVSRQAAQRVGVVGAVHGDGHRGIRPHLKGQTFPWEVAAVADEKEAE